VKRHSIGQRKSSQEKRTRADSGCREGLNQRSLGPKREHCQSEHKEKDNPL
jgi:hypothetical protein